MTSTDPVSSRPSLLFLCQNLPYPPDGGALARSYHTVRLLAGDFDVTALCFFRSAMRSTSAEVERGLEGLREFARVEAFPIPQDGHRPRLLADHLASLVSGRAYTRWTYESRPFRRRLRELLTRERFDLAHVESLDLVAYLGELSGTPVVLAHHNIESQLLASRARAETGWRRWYVQHQAGLTEDEERQWCTRMAANLVVSETDADRLRRIAPRSRCIVMPNGVDTGFFRPYHDVPRRGIVFVGGHTWFPNRDGMAHFVDEVLPRIRAAHPTVPVTWVGRASPGERRRYRERGVEMTGYVDDIRPIVAAAACFIVPIRVGGGTRLKILDAWALGKAIVSTRVGCEGLHAISGKNMLIADDDQAFAEAVVRVIESKELQDRLGREGRRTAESRYDWDVIGRAVLPHYHRLIS